MAQQGMWAAVLAAVVGGVAPALGAAGAAPVTFNTVDWPPFYAESLPKGGPLVQVTREAFAREGYAVDVEFMNWKRGILEVEQGETDFQLGAWITADRQQRFAFTDVVAYTNDVLLARREVALESYDSLADLQPYRIGMGRGWDFGERIERAQLDIFRAANQKQLLGMLFVGRLDMIVETEAVVRATIRQTQGYTMAEVKVLEPPLRQGRLAHAIAREHPRRAELVSAFNRGLARLRRSGRFDELLPAKRFNAPRTP